MDILRGFAIFTMVAANAAPYALHQPHPLWFRCWGTFAAPLFIAIAGYFVVKSAAQHARSFGYFLARGGATLLTGMLIDVSVWRIWPLMTVDVLYLIGVSLPLVYLGSRLPRWLQGSAVLAIFLSAPLLRSHFGYASAIYAVPVSGGISWRDFPAGVIARQWLLDGWFPLLPWLGFACVGAWLEPVRDSKWILPVAFGLLIVGIPLFLRFHGPLYVREDYSELFYPPTTAYVILAFAVMGLCLKLVDRLAAARALRPLACMGQCSLAMYVLHLVLIEFAVVPYLPKQGMIGFSVVYLALILLLVAAAYGIRQVKQVWPRRRWLLQFVLGA